MKWITAIFIAIIIIGVVEATETYLPCGGDEELMIGCLGDEELFFIGSVPSVTEQITPVTGAGASGSAGSRGGGCWSFAKQYNTCYYADLNTGLCTLGCPTNYECNPNYSFESLTGEDVITYCVLTTTTGPLRRYSSLAIVVVSITLVVSISRRRKMIYLANKEKKKYKKKEEKKVIESEVK